MDGAGVRLMVVTHQGARQAFADLSRASGRDEVYVQRMAPPGTACVFALLDDPSFGSLLSFGLSGMARSCSATARTGRCRCRPWTRPSWSASPGRRRCCPATAASRRPGWTRWKTSRCG